MTREHLDALNRTIRSCRSMLGRRDLLGSERRYWEGLLREAENELSEVIESVWR
jgi:hypothetical protein